VDWIESFLHFTKDIPSPEIFRLWTAISIIAGAANRRVWFETSQNILYPNLYILLVAPPGIGKTQAIERAGFFWRETTGLHVAPDSVTRASLLDTLAAATTKDILPNGDFQMYHALNVAAGEFGVLCPAHDLEFLNTLNDLYDARKTFSEARRHRGEKILTIDYPMLHILAGTQPMYLSALLPEAAWGMGFTARVLMIYSAEIIKTDPFEALTKGSADLKKDLVLDLESISKLWGAFEWTDEAKALLKAWHAQDLAPIPTHSRLQNYNTRRLLHVLKLCMVSSLSRHSALCIELPDVQRAQSWLLEAENKMPDIFREMAGQSDKAVIDDLYDVLWRLFIGNKKPIHESVIIRFLSGKVPSEKVMRVLQIALSSNVIEKVPNMDNYYKPGMRDNIRGVE
jgi:hypothetical protein